MTRANPKCRLLSYLCISSHYLRWAGFNYIEKYNLENLDELDAKITEVLDLLSPFEVTLVIRIAQY